MCKDNDLCIRWYTNTASLVFKGERVNEVSEKFITIVQRKDNQDQAEFNPFQLNMDLQIFRIYLHLMLEKYNDHRTIKTLRSLDIKWWNLSLKQMTDSKILHKI